MSNKLAYSIPEAAELLSISPRLMKREVASGRVKSVKIGRRTVVPHWALDERLSPATTVEDLLAQFERGGAVSTPRPRRG